MVKKKKQPKIIPFGEFNLIRFDSRNWAIYKVKGKDKKKLVNPKMKFFSHLEFALTGLFDEMLFDTKRKKGTVKELRQVIIDSKKEILKALERSNFNG